MPPFAFRRMRIGALIGAVVGLILALVPVLRPIGLAYAALPAAWFGTLAGGEGPAAQVAALAGFPVTFALLGSFFGFFAGLLYPPREAGPPRQEQGEGKETR